MAQRVYLLPIKLDFLQMLQEYVLSEGPRPDAIWKELEGRGLKQGRLNAASRRVAACIDSEEAARTGRGDDLALAANLRPYFITGDDSAAAVDAVVDLMAADPDEAEDFLRKEGEKFGELFRAERFRQASEDRSPESWRLLRQDVDKARSLREAFKRDEAVEVEVPKVVASRGGVQVYQGGKTERKSFKGPELAQLFGAKLGNCLGRLSGLCEPSWWLGRNYWLGAMAFADHDFPEEHPAQTFQDFLMMKVRNPASMLTALYVPGFDAGFDVGCPAYSTGLYFAYDAVLWISQGLEQVASGLEALGEKVTGYSRRELRTLEQSLREAFDWASRSECGLMEGDELVGSLGSRG